MIRLGLLSDLHCELEPAGAHWINAFEPENLDRRLDEALAWFADAAADAVVVLGDFVQTADPRSLEHVLGRLARNAPAPLLAVSGNHDLRVAGEFAAGAEEHGVRLLADGALDIAGLGVSGVRLRRAGPDLPFYVGDHGLPAGDELIVVTSHFPLLSEAERVAAAGMPYAGDLVNRSAVLTEVSLAPSRPIVTVNGHIHARCSRIQGPVLQCTVGALIEPPFDCTILEVDLGHRRVRRTARRLGPVMPVDPVFAPDEESWIWSGQKWEPE
jgi:Calcineurin-like phosphoesterase superfamily domain